jgi:hypothetical protein
MAERGANQRHCGESWRAPSPACAVLEFDRYHWLDPHSRRLCRTIRHQCRHSAGVPAWYRSPDMAAAVRGYCDVSGRCGVCADVLAHHDGSASRPAVGSGTRVGRRHLLYRPLLQRSRWSVFGLGALCGLAAAIKPSAFPASLTCIELAAGAQLICECLEADGGGFRAAVRRAGLPPLIFVAGLLAGTFAIAGFELVNTLHYIRIAMVDYRDFWVFDESFRDSLLHYSVGVEGRTALSYWLWFGLESYFLGAMFYGVFIVAMALNLCAIIGGLEGILSRLTLGPAFATVAGFRTSHSASCRRALAVMCNINTSTGRSMPLRKCCSRRMSQSSPVRCRIICPGPGWATNSSAAWTLIPTCAWSIHCRCSPRG